MKQKSKRQVQRFVCQDCHRETDTLLLDGYAVGDRVLEGVMFEVQYTDGKAAVKVRQEDADYFKTLNQKMWLREMKDYAEETDMANCPNCGGDIVVNETKPGIEVQVQTFDEIFRLLNK